MTFKFDMIQSVAFAVVLLFLGIYLCRKVKFLNRYNIPAPVVGGLIFAIVDLFARNYVTFTFDTTLQDSFMLAFFTTIGFSASINLLKKGGKQLIIFLIAASVLVFFQDVLSYVLSRATGLDPLLGLLAGSVTMSGGHGTGATFARYFTSQFHLQGAMEVAMAAATFGLVSGSLLGGPLAKLLIERKKLTLPGSQADGGVKTEEIEIFDKEPIEQNDILRTIAQLLLAMAVGAYLYKLLVAVNVQVPTYLCALFVGILIRNVSDTTGLYKVNARLVSMMGSVALSLFLAMALMSMQLWQLEALAIPLATILIAQVVLMALFAYFITFNLNGRDYDAAVLCAGHCGFGLGATPNAIANMQALVNKYGPSPKAFFIVSIVGAFFIDIVNAFVIQGFVTFIR